MSDSTHLSRVVFYGWDGNTEVVLAEKQLNVVVPRGDAIAVEWAPIPPRTVRYPIMPPDPCHCGEPVAFGYDGDPTHHRGMCEDCDAVRCDAYPGDCGR